MSSGAVNANEEKTQLDPLTKFALIMSMLSFIIPFVTAVVAFVSASIAKGRLSRTGGDRMNEGLATIAQATATFTTVLYGAFLWYAERTWG